jgi:hypothetical protein
MARRMEGKATAVGTNLDVPSARRRQLWLSGRAVLLRKASAERADHRPSARRTVGHLEDRAWLTAAQVPPCLGAADSSEDCSRSSSSLCRLASDVAL